MRKAYEEYVSFNDVWFTRIPITWQSHKMKHLFCERSEKGYPHEQLLVASQNMGIVPKTIYGSRTVEAQKDLQLLKLVKIGDFVISLRSFEGGIEYAYYQGIISPAYTVLTTKGNIQRGYFRYLAKSKPFVKLLSLCVTGIREGQNIDYGKLKNHLLPIPPREEQEQIVRFLDWKVSSINKLINLKQQEITELKELKKATISDAVIHGLDKTVPMKDSGITWIGKIPKHWKLAKIKNLADSIGSGTTPSSTNELNYQSSGINWLQSGDLYKKTLILNTSKCIAKEVFKNYSALKIYRAPFVVIAMYGASIGNVAISKIDSCVNQACCCIKPSNNVLLKFLYYWVVASKATLLSIAEGGSQPNISQQKIKNHFLPIPPRDEQEKIARFLDARCAEIDRLIDANQAQITNLHDLKSSLIADVVTGQIDVRDVEIPDYEQVAESLYEADDNATLQSEDEIPEEV